jgi:hypothetical protein
VESNSGRVSFFIVSCSRHVVILHYTNSSDNKIVYFSIIYYRTSFYDPTVSNSVDPTSDVRSSAMLVLPIVGN